MKPKRPLLIQILALLLLLSAVAGFLFSYWPSKEAETETKPPKVLRLDLNGENQSFAWKDLTLPQSSAPVRLIPPQTKSTMILFWASWCYPCWEELEALAKNLDLLKKLDLSIVPIGVAMTEEHLELAFEMWDKFDLPFSLQWDSDNFYQERYNIDGLPQALLLDSRHRVRRQLIGSLPLERKPLRDFLTEQLAELELDTN